jgi:oligopeptide transport system substrate-binding protein
MKGNHANMTMTSQARRLLRLFTWLAVLLTLAGCVRRGGRVAQGNKDQVMYWSNGADPQDLDPQTVTGEPESHILNALFEGLVSQDPQTLGPIPGVAESWDISPDKRVYTFHLRKDARWSNGDSVTSRDFLESYRRMLMPTLGAEYAEMLFKDAEVVNAREFYEGKITDFSQVGFRAPDDRTFIVTLKYPASYFLTMLNHQSWYPVHLPTILKHGKIDEKSTRWTLPGNLVGNGPFVLKRWRVQQDVVVEKSPTYWNAGIVRLKEIHYIPNEDISSEERAFRSGQLHVTNDVPQSKIDTYKQLHPDYIRITPYLGSYYYRFNVTNPVIKDKRVRRALAMAVDREKLVKHVTRGGQSPANNFTPPGMSGYTSRATIPTDFEGARRLLAEAGFPDGKGLPPVEILINTSQNHRAIAEAIQDMWREQLHIDARIANQEWKVYLDSMTKLDYCAARSGWIGDYIDPMAFLGLMVSGGGNNCTGFANPEYDRLIQAAAAASNDAERLEAFQSAEAILMDEAVILPLYFYTRVYLKQPSVKGWYSNVQDRHMPQFIYLEDDGSTELRRAPSVPAQRQ